MQTLRKGTCPGLSGTNKITYQIGAEADKSIWLQLVESSRGGYVCKEWVAMGDIMKTLTDAKAPFTSYALYPHFKGKSVNSLSFMMAVLKHEGLVAPDKTKPMAFVADGMDVAVAKFEKAVLATIKRKPEPKKAASK